jgi:hypothetical protein
MNRKLQFLDKRDSKGSLLMLSGRELSFQIAEKSFDEIKKYKSYSKIIKHIPEKYVEMYFKRMFYEYSMGISSQIVILDHDNKNSSKVRKQLINLGNFPCVDILKKVLQRNDLIYFRGISYFYNRFKKKIKIFLSLNKKFQNNSSSVYSSICDNQIGISYGESLDINRRSDIFWLPDSKIEPRSVLVYFENKVDYNKYLDHIRLGAKQDYEIQLVKLWEWNNIPNQFYKILKIELLTLKESDPIEKWFIKSINNLVSEINYWLSFFIEFNISIHSDSSENGLGVIIKQIAINKIGGLSYGKLRSYTYNRVDYAYSVFPNDIFFVWGAQSANTIKKSINHIDNIVLSGFPYNPELLKTDNELIDINEAFSKKNTKFNILIVDSNHGLNLKWHQVIHTSAMIKFYKSFLQWVVEDNEIGLIIKPKKIEFINRMQSVLSYFNDVSIETGRCHLVKDPYQKMAASFIDRIDLVVSISFNMPSSLIECVSFGKKAVIFDSTNLRFIERTLYESGENKVIFQNFDTMFETIKNYKNSPSDFPKIGDWSAYLDDIDAFQDSKGSMRIGNYLKFVQDALNKGLSNYDAINYANQKYTEIWGSNKVIN